MKTLLLNEKEVASLIDLDRILAAVEDGYRSFNSGKVVQPDFMAVHIPDMPGAGIDFKGGLDMGGGYISIKASSGGYDKNPEKGLPIGMNTVMLFEADTSALVCILDGTWITGCRTGRGRRHLGQVPGPAECQKALRHRRGAAGPPPAAGHHPGAQF